MDPTRVSLRRLHCFRVLAETLHFGRAAELLDITQPGLSQEISKLEAEVGVRVFTRTPRVTLTDAGRRLLSASGELLNASALFAREARSLAAKSRHRVVLAITPSIIHRHLGDAVAKLQADDPQLDVHVHELNTASALLAVQSGEADIAVAHGSEETERPMLTTRLISREDLCFAAPVHWQGSAEELLGERPFIVFRREVSPQFHDRIVRALEVNGARPSVQHHTSSWASTLELVRRGFGVALVPWVYAHGYAADPKLRFEEMETPVASDIWAAIRTEDVEGYKGRVFGKLPSLLA